MFAPFEAFKKQYQNKKVLILGLGLQGRGVGDAQFFAQIGSQVTVTDLKTEKELQSSIEQLKGLPIKLVLGQHRQEDIVSADLIIRNATVPWHSPFLELARKNQVKIEMDCSLFAQFCPWPIIGITGTRGKTTTATLIYELLKASGRPAFLGGNVYGQATLPLLKKIDPQVKNGWVVLELSSWQLQAWRQNKISPHLAVVTNFYPDHLNFYAKLGDYLSDKKAIFQNQTKNDFLILNQDDPTVKLFQKEALSQVVFFSANDFPDNWELKIAGNHNRANAAAAYRIGQILKLDDASMQSVFSTFRNLPFRQEKIGEINGVTYINDATSTMPEATIAALETINSPIILIAGGSTKNLKMKTLASVINQRVKKLILLKGEGSEELKKTLKTFPQFNTIFVGEFASLQEALLIVQKISQSGETVLFSPGCTSFGLFLNEFDRGQKFNQIFKKIQNHALSD